jgi:nicotinamide riboside kinase
MAEAAPEAMSAAVCIAIVGAESTGKTQLAAELAQALSHQTGRRVAWVPEMLRSWCERTGRTPLAHEQAPILRAQHEQIEAAAASHDIVVCDTTALMTAVYSRLIFSDRSLDERAATLHRRRIAATLLMAVDLPWVSDGHQRDGPHVREPVDTALRELMLAHGIGFAVVGGSGSTRLAQAMAALAPALRGEATAADAGGGRSEDRSSGLFTGLGGARRGGWACECCLPDQERALRRAAAGPQ